MGRKMVFDLSHGVFPIMEDAGRKGSICRVCVFLQHILDMLLSLIHISEPTRP